LKKKILGILITLGILVGLIVSASVPVAAASHWVLYGTIGGKYLVTIDETTGDATADVTLISDGYSVGKIAFDPTTETLYGLATYGTSHTPYLAAIDIITGVVNVIAPITLPGHTVYFAEGLAIDPSGTIYVAMSINGDYPPDYSSESLVTVTVDPSTAVATKVGNIDPTIQHEADGIEFVGYTLYGTDDPGSGPTNI
jgi:putative N-acetylmannosamine-6-phosphate epimerase